jgi:hypothetical protein
VSLGFAYQMGLLHLTDGLPRQQPLEILHDLLAFVAQESALDLTAMRPSLDHLWVTVERMGLHRFARGLLCDESPIYIGPKSYSFPSAAVAK